VKTSEPKLMKTFLDHPQSYAKRQRGSYFLTKPQVEANDPEL
jgi:hypothetical protein